MTIYKSAKLIILSGFQEVILYTNGFMTTRKIVRSV